MLATIRAIDPEARTKKQEFTLAAPGGRIFHRYDELPNAEARGAVKRYLSAAQELAEAESNLSDQRRRYADSRSESLGRQIAQAEARIEKTRSDVARLRSEAYKVIK